MTQAWSKKFALFIFYFIIVSQFLAGPLSLNKWPFTNYAMFSTAYEDFTEMARLKLCEHYDGPTAGREIIKCWSKEDFSSDYQQLNAFLKMPNSPELTKLLKKIVSERKYKHPPIAISLWKKIVRIENDKLTERNEFFLKYEYKILAK